MHSYTYFMLMYSIIVSLSVHALHNESNRFDSPSTLMMQQRRCLECTEQLLSNESLDLCCISGINTVSGSIIASQGLVGHNLLLLGAGSGLISFAIVMGLCGLKLCATNHDC